MGEACGMNGGEEKCMQGFGAKPEGVESRGRPRHKWVNNIQIWLKEIRCEDVCWMQLAQVRDKWWAIASTQINNRVS